jgi:hypothetical protein
LRGAPGEEQFEREYQAALSGAPILSKEQQRTRRRHRGVKDRRGVIYVVQCGDDAAVKIGFTARHYLDLRLASLQTGNPAKLRLVAQAEGFFWQEKAAHVALAGARIQGEWFSWTPATQEFVEALAMGIEPALERILPDGLRG